MRSLEGIIKFSFAFMDVLKNKANNHLFSYSFILMSSTIQRFYPLLLQSKKIDDLCPSGLLKKITKIKTIWCKNWCKNISMIFLKETKDEHVWGFLMFEVRHCASWSETLCRLEWDLLMIEVRRLLIEVRQSAGFAIICSAGLRACYSRCST